jgi:hypothetical protein
MAALRQADPPSKESYRLCIILRNWKGGQSSKGCRAIERERERERERESVTILQRTSLGKTQRISITVLFIICMNASNLWRDFGRTYCLFLVHLTVRYVVPTVSSNDLMIVNNELSWMGKLLSRHLLPRTEENLEQSIKIFCVRLRFELLSVWCSGNAVELYYGGIPFESRAGHQLLWWICWGIRLSRTEYPWLTETCLLMVEWSIIILGTGCL